MFKKPEQYRIGKIDGKYVVIVTWGLMDTGHVANSKGEFRFETQTEAREVCKAHAAKFKVEKPIILT